MHFKSTSSEKISDYHLSARVDCFLFFGSRGVMGWKFLEDSKLTTRSPLLFWKNCKVSSCKVSPVLAFKRFRCVSTVEGAIERIEPISLYDFPSCNS